MKRLKTNNMFMLNTGAFTSIALMCVLVTTGISHADQHGDNAYPYEQVRTELKQNWSPAVREKFWFTSQGSRILPYAWFLALEQAQSEALFRDDRHMDGLRYLPQGTSPMNPDALPIGFVADADGPRDRKWLGMTCAACHTNQIDYDGTSMIIEGGPTLANFVGFFDALVDALIATRDNSDKYQRFVQRVLGNDASNERNAALKVEFDAISQTLAERREINALPSDYPTDFTSYARLDAFGNIENAATALALNNPLNRNAPTAPVSYPFLWGAHQSDKVQWNGSASNESSVGPLVRNVGEVVGVFGGLQIQDRPVIRHKYPSTVDINGLVDLEAWVKDLRSPRWPAEILGSIDQRKARVGEEVFGRSRENGGCRECHQVIERASEGDTYKAQMRSVAQVGTDSAMVDNVACHRANTLSLEGEDKYILIGENFGQQTAAINIAVNGVVGIILDDKRTVIDALKRTQTNHADGSWLKKYWSKGKRLKERLIQFVETQTEAVDACPDGVPNHDVLKYKARPLNAIWATAPYLHNGSVPTLWELLKKPNERMTEFGVGSREFDPTHVGYVDDRSFSTFRVLSTNGEIQHGNSNRGHNYGTSLSQDEKWALIEYLKQL